MKKDKKYQIFISSTYLDLIEERQTAVQTIVKMGHIPAGMELFKAGASQWQTITKWIDASDIYVLILGGRYGTINEQEGKSYTHLEYEYALSTGMPVFALVLEDKFLEEKNINSETEVFEKDNVEKYNEFKEFVKKKIVKFISDIKDIQIEIQDNIRDIEMNRNLEGWVKGDNTENYIDTLKENFTLLKENQKLIQENQKLKEKIRTLEENEKEIFSCGLTFEELKEVLNRKTVTFPAKLIDSEKDEDCPLLIAFKSYKSQLSSGIRNQKGAGEAEIFLYWHIASEILSYNLCEIKKAPGNATWSTIALNSEGKKFLSLLEKDKIK